MRHPSWSALYRVEQESFRVVNLGDERIWGPHGLAYHSFCTCGTWRQRRRRSFATWDKLNMLPDKETTSLHNFCPWWSIKLTHSPYTVLESVGNHSFSILCNSWCFWSIQILFFFYTAWSVCWDIFLLSSVLFLFMICPRNLDFFLRTLTLFSVFWNFPKGLKSIMLVW